MPAHHPMQTFDGSALDVRNGCRLCENANALRNRRTILSATARRAHRTASPMPQNACSSVAHESHEKIRLPSLRFYTPSVDSSC